MADNRTIKRRLAGAAALLLGTGLAQAAMAQAGPPSGPPPQGDNVIVGLGVGVTSSYDGSDQYKAIPGGTLRGTVSGHDFQLNGPQLFVDAIPNDASREVDIELGPVIGLGMNRTGEVKDSQVAALGELDTAVEIGLRGSLGKRGIFGRADKLALSATVVRDVAGAHDDWTLSPAVEYSTPVGSGSFLRAAISAEFVGGRYADYYFGVTPAGTAASGLRSFDPDGGLASLGTSLLATHSLGGGRKGWSLFGIASYKRLQGEIAASPLVRDVGSADQVFGSVGLAYSF